MYEHLLVPIDGSELSDRAMTSSIALARKLGARITGFIVEPFAPPPASIGEGYSYGRTVARHDETVHKQTEDLMARFQRLATEAGVGFQALSKQSGRIEESIIEAAEQNRCDLIVMTTHGRSTIGELLWGSHTKALMSSTRLPVLVLH